MTGSSSGYETVTTSPRSERVRCLNVVVRPCARSGRYIRPVRPSLGSSIHLMFGSSGFIYGADIPVCQFVSLFFNGRQECLPHGLGTVIGDQGIDDRGYEPGDDEGEPGANENGGGPGEFCSIGIVDLAG